MATKDMDKLVNHAKSTGFVYQGSEIYDGLANTWDYWDPETKGLLPRTFTFGASITF